MAHRGIRHRTDTTTVLVMGDFTTSIGFTQGELKDLETALITILRANAAAIDAALPVTARAMTDAQKDQLIFNYMRPNRLR